MSSEGGAGSQQKPSDNQGVSQGSPQGAPKTGYAGNEYQITGHGTNERGSHYCNRDYGSGAPNPHSYHYSNENDSFYYKNPDGSAY